MPRRECLGCRRLISSGSRCPACDTHSQDYGATYRKARTVALATADRCTTCGCAFTTDNPATGGHVVALRFGGRHSGVVAQCATCNFSHLND